MIDVKDLHKRFGENEVLQGITEHIDRGEKVVVIGPSGSGKSTFLRCLNLLEIPTSGEIFFDGVSINRPENQHQSNASEDGLDVPAFQPVS